MDGFARNFARGSSRARNHLFQILCRLVQGFRICAASNFAILLLLSRSPYELEAYVNGAIRGSTCI